MKSDPAYFDAYYNLGLAALDAGEVKLSLWAYEIALALKPESADARYNLALALKAGSYFQDVRMPSALPVAISVVVLLLAAVAASAWPAARAARINVIEALRSE